MIKPVTMFTALGLAALGATAALAQADDRKLIIYGNDRCPANTICVRAPESERYRIPKTIRETTKSGEEPWGSRASSVANAGAASGTGSCTATGPGGWTGCWGQQMRAARAERKAKKEEDAVPGQ